MEYFVGIDLHKFFFVYYAEDSSGKEFAKGKLDNTPESVEELIKLFKTSPKVVIEAGANWMWLVKALNEKGCQVTLAHPLKVKAIASARIKTDKIDAKTLCHLLRGDLLPKSYIASEEIQDNRELSRARISLVHDQSMIKNRIHAIFTKDNLKFSGGTDLFGVKGRIWMKDQISKLSTPKQQMINLYLKRLDELKKDIHALDEIIKQKSSSDPRVKLLNTIPGIGSTTAFLLTSEIGEISRFKSAKAFSSYFGLVPRISQSGFHAYYGRITKLGNPFVRWSLVQASYRIIRIEASYKKWVDHLSYKSGKKKAIVAMSRKMATIVYAVLKENRPYIANYQTTKEKVCPASIPGKKEQAITA